MAAGGGTQSRGPTTSFNENQSVGVRNLRGALHHDVAESVPHQDRTQDTTEPPVRVSAPSLKGRKHQGPSPPLNMPSSRSPLERPSIPASFILVPATWVT
eukprot:scaffold6474_cov23-Cyclotella_meneghiniana.AAC.3